MRTRERIGTILVIGVLAAGCAASRPEPDTGRVPPTATGSDLKRLQTEARDSFDRGDLAGAEQRLDEAEALAPGDPETSYLRGILLEARGEIEDALPHLRAAWEADSGKGERRDACVRVLAALAEEQYHNNDFSGAWERLTEARRVDSGADLSYLEGTVAYAMAQSLVATEASPEDLRAVERRRWLKQSEESFRKAIERDDQDDDARFNLAAVLLAADRGDEAAEVYRDLLARTPEDPEIYLALAHAYEAAGDPRQASLCRLIGRALSLGKTVDDVPAWTARRAEESATWDDVLRERGAPESIRVAQGTGQSSVEVWIYGDDRRIEVFEQGKHLGRFIWR